jgi:hypothetical protein
VRPDFFSAWLNKLVGEEQMLEEQAPNEIDPAADDRNEDAEDEADNVSYRGFLNNGCDTDDDFSDPVDARNEKKKDLNKTALLVKPFHRERFPPF